MTRMQWAMVAAIGIVALVAFRRTEVIQQKLGMGGIVPLKNASGYV